MANTTSSSGIAYTFKLSSKWNSASNQQSIYNQQLFDLEGDGITALKGYQQAQQYFFFVDVHK